MLVISKYFYIFKKNSTLIHGIACANGVVKCIKHSHSLMYSLLPIFYFLESQFKCSF